jgi:cytochrome P450
LLVISNMSLFWQLLCLPLVPVGLVVLRFCFIVIKYRYNKRKYLNITTFCHPKNKGASFFRLHSASGGAMEMQKEAFDPVNQQYHDLTHQGMDQDGLNMVGLAHPDDIQLALTQHEVFVKPDLFDKVKISLGNGLAASAGEDWRRQKKILDPIFSPQFMSKIFPLMVSSTNHCIGVLKAQNGQVVDVIKYFSNSLWEVQLATMFQGHSEKKAKLIHSFGVIAEALFPVFMLRVLVGPLDFLLKPFGVETKAVNERKEIDRILGDVIQEKRQRKKGEPEDILSAMAQTELTDMEIFDNVMTLNFGAHETTTNQLAWCVYFLSKHPEYQTKLRNYLREKNFDLETMTAEKLEEFPFLTNVVKEAARIYPITNANGRRLTKPMKMANGVVLPKDTVVNLMAGYVQNDPRFWDRPNDFYPERWEDNSQRHPFLYFNFSGGPRVCIGELYAWHVMRLFVAAIVLQFNVDANVDKVEVDTSALTSPKGLKANFVPL